VRRDTRDRPVLAGERAGAYRRSPGSNGQALVAAPDGSSRSPWETALVRMETATDEVGAVDLDAMSEGEVQAWLAGLQRQLDRLEGVKRRSAGALRGRVVRRQGTGRESRARREVDEFLREGLRLSPADVKRTCRAGLELDADPSLARAVDDGRLRPDHVEVIAGATRELEPALAEQVQATLTAAAAGQDPTELGRTARRLLAEVAPDTAERAQRRSYARRYARLSAQPDGSLLINARVAAGLDAETALTWVDKYRSPDGEGEHRSPEQRTCDAMLAGMRQGWTTRAGRACRGSPRTSPCS
jgi:hypothetical protein